MKKFNDLYNEYLKKIENKNSLDIYEENELNDTLIEINKKIDQLNKDRMMLKQLLDYNKLLKDGFDNTKIKEFLDEDLKFIKKTEKFVEEYLENRNTMFGYPANMADRSGTTEYLRFLESKMYLINNCGDPNESGNYKMDSKEIELQILDMMKENLGLKKSDYFGYITSGGTEGNFWGIREGFSKFNNGVLYYSDEAHYSIEKFVKFGNTTMFENCKIKSDKKGRIETELLIKEIEKNWNERRKPAILVLTWGTTKTGEIDDIKTIQNILKNKKIPHYLHIDAALYGGIPKNQEDAPIISKCNIDFDSIAISLHKYIGSPKVNGVIIAKKKLNNKFIDYIGQEDTTYLGSRDSLVFSVYQQIKELFYRSKNDEYKENIIYTEKMLKDNNIKYEKSEHGNIFLVTKLSDKICQKYQLSSFEKNKKEYTHIIIFPYHKRKYINSLILEIKDEQHKVKKN